MRHLNRISLFRSACALIAVFAWHTATAVTAGHVDNFEDGTTQGWGEGASSPNPPANIANGGPTGIGDNFLENLSTGGESAGSKQIIFNTSANWTGDFASAGINVVRLHVRVDSGSEGPLQLRLAFEGSNGAQWASTTPVEVPADDTWHSVMLPVMQSTMSNVLGGGTFAAAASNVVAVRLMHATAASWMASPFNGLVGYDNIATNSVSLFSGWIWETGVSNFPTLPELEEEHCFGTLALGIDSSDNWQVVGNDACIGRVTVNNDPARYYLNYDSLTNTIPFVGSFEARSTRPLVSAGGNLLELYGEDVEGGVGLGEARLATVLAEPTDSDLLIVGGFDSYADPFFTGAFGFVDVLVKDSPDSRFSRLASDLEGRWYQTVFGRFIGRQNVSTNVATGTMRVIDFEPGGVCTFEEASVLPDPEVVNNGDFYTLAQIAYAGGLNLTDRGVFAGVTARTRSACTYAIDGNGNLSVEFTNTDNTQAPPVETPGNMVLAVSDDNNYFVPALDPAGFESSPNFLVVGFRAPEAIAVEALDGDYLFYLNVAEQIATGLGHTAQATGPQLLDVYGRGSIKFDSTTPGTVPAGQAGAWYSCEVELAMNSADFRADGQPSLGEVTTDLQVFAESQTLDCDYSLSVDGGLLLNLIVSEPGEPVEQVLFAGYVSANGEVLSLIDFFAEIENPESQLGSLSDIGSLRHVVGMKYTGDLSGNEDNDEFTNFEEFQLPLPPKPSTVFGDVTTLMDLGFDGIPELASFGAETFDTPSVNIYDGASGGFFTSIQFLNDKWQGIKLATVRDPDQDGIQEDPAVAMLAVNKTTDKIRVAVVSAATGAPYYSIQFLNENWRAVDVVVVDDLNGDGLTNDTAIAVLSERYSDGRVQLQLRDMDTGSLISNVVYLNARWTPIAAAVVNRPEQPPLIGVIAEKPDDGRRVLQSRVAGSGAFDQNIKVLGSAWDYQDVSVIYDANGDGVANDPVWAVLAARPSDNVIRVQSRFVSDGSFDDNLVILNENWQSFRLDGAPDMGGGPGQELVITAIRRADGQRRIHVKDYNSGATTINIAP